MSNLNPYYCAWCDSNDCVHAELKAARARIAELETAQLARDDRAYYDGAKAYRSMVQVKTVCEKFSPSSHQEYDLTEADTWLHGGCAGRREASRRLGGQTI